MYVVLDQQAIEPLQALSYSLGSGRKKEKKNRKIVKISQIKCGYPGQIDQSKALELFDPATIIPSLCEKHLSISSIYLLLLSSHSCHIHLAAFKAATLVWIIDFFIYL